MTVSDEAYRQLAEAIVDLQKKYDSLSTSQLGRSSLENQSIRTYDANGQIAGAYGRLPDGSYGSATLSGPVPPIPSAPKVQAVRGVGLEIEWDGMFQDSQAVVPLEGGRLEVYVHETPDITPVLVPVYSMGSPRGEKFLISVGYDKIHYVAFAFRAASGKVSPASAVVGPCTVGRATKEDLEVNFDEFNGTTIFYGPDEPTTSSADLWLRDNPDGTQTALRYNPDTAQWIGLQDQGVVQALNEASAANETAVQAGIDALAAQDTAGQAEQVAADAASAAAVAQGAADLAKSTADSKVTVYRQASAPTGGTYRINDLWLDTDDGNKLYAWTGSWTVSDDQRIATALTDAGTAQTTANSKTTLFAQVSAPSTTGRTIGDVWLDTDDGNKRYVWTGSWTASPIGAAGISATARQLGAITTYRQASAPTTGMLVGDFWIDSDDNVVHRYDGAAAGWVRSQDVNINTAITNAATAKAVADGKMRIFTQVSPPTGLTADDVGDMWIDTDDSNVSYTWSGTAWTKRQLGNGAIVPNSLVASDVIATGTISAALFEALLVLTTDVIAGDPLGDHARMTPNGFRVYQNDPIDGVPNEVIRMGTETSDYFGVVNDSGMLVASIDDTGQMSARLVTTSGLIVAGRDLSVAVNSAPRGEVAHFLGSIGFDYGPIFNPVGVVEVGLEVEAGRSYHIKWRMPVYVQVAGVQVQVNARITEGADGNTTVEPPAPTITSPFFAEWRFMPAGTNQTQTIYGEAMWLAQRTTRVRWGLTIQTGPEGAVGNVGVRNLPVEINVLDVGRHVGRTGAFTNMGGSLNGQTSAPPPPSVAQTYYVDLAPAGWTAIRGNGSTRTDVPGPVQGYDPSGYNGNGKGHWWFNMPNITGNITRMDFYAYSNHWYNNSGGTAVFNIATGSAPYNKPFGDWHSPGWPKPGGREVLLPSEWYPYFRSAGAGGFPQANGITIGPGPDNNGLYYGRFDGPSARLRIHFTQ